MIIFSNVGAPTERDALGIDFIEALRFPPSKSTVLIYKELT